MSSAIHEDTIVLAGSQQVTGDLPDGDVVILNLKDGVYYGLNEVGGRIWQLIQEPVTVYEIQEILLQEFDVDADQCYQDVVTLLRELASRGLIHLDQAVVHAT